MDIYRVKQDILKAMGNELRGPIGASINHRPDPKYILTLAKAYKVLNQIEE